MIFSERFKERQPPDPRPDGAVPFIVDTGGAGDLINTVGFIRGYREAGIKSWAVSNRDDYRNLLGLLGEEPVDDPEGGIYTGGVAYYYEGFIKGGNKKGFINYLSERLPGNPRWSPPEVRCVPEDLAWVAEKYEEAGGSGKNVVVFPFAAWSSRDWPLSYWADLTWALKHAGHRVICVLPHDKETGGAKAEANKVLTASIWGLAWQHTAALIQKADLVIGNDSGPAHLAGAIGRPTIALCGPTTGMFDQFPTVSELSLHRKELSCVGCWFDGDVGYRGACDRGCEALMRLAPGSVYRMAERLLDTGELFPNEWRPSPILPHLHRNQQPVTLTARRKEVIHAGTTL